MAKQASRTTTLTRLAKLAAQVQRQAEDFADAMKKFEKTMTKTSSSKTSSRSRPRGKRR